VTTEPEFAVVPTNGIRLNVARAGPADGPLVILLHGFPEFWYGWRQQIGPLADAGFRVLAPDQRGYNTSDKPEGLRAYAIDALAADVIGLIDDAGRERAALVGHDWGGIVAWWAALRHPERVERIAALNAPHPAVLRRAWRNPAQLLRSWYVFVLQLPWLPEALLRRGGWRALADSLRRTSRPGTFREEDIERYRRAWSQPGAITAMINWYRAWMRAHPGRPKDERVRIPWLLIWGARDRFLGTDVARASLEFCDSGRLVFLEQATHWVQHEEPGHVNRLLLDFLGQPESTKRPAGAP
jgi:pimeloyl-ACP methyl ester carboxylesterase